MRKVLNSILTIVSCLSIVSFHSCSQEEEYLTKDDFAELKSELSSIDTVGIVDSISQIKVDSMTFVKYMAFRENNKEAMAIKSMKASYSNIETRGIQGNYHIESTISDNIYAIRDMPIRIFSRGGGYSILATNGKGKELKFMARALGRGANNHKFYFRALPASSGISQLLYSYSERTPISVGTYSSDPNNPVLFVLNNESGSLYNASFSFSFAKENGYLQWTSDALIAQGSSGNWQDIYYKAAENRNNKTAFSQYTGNNPAQDWLFTPDNTFSLDDIEFSQSYNTRIIRQGEEKVQGGEKNELKNTYLPSVNVYFPKKVEEKSSFITNRGINFAISDGGKRFQLPTIINGQINTWASQRDPRVAVYSENEQRISKDFNSFIATSLEPRTKIETIYSYRWYDVEVDFTAKISCTYNNILRKTTLKGVWKGRIWCDPFAPVFYRFIDLDTNKILEEGYLDISGYDTKSGGNKMIQMKPTNRQFK